MKINDMPLKFYVSQITAALEQSHEDLAKSLRMDAGPEKSMAIISVIADLHNELMFVRSSMNGEIRAEKAQKKFWQFWK